MKKFKVGDKVRCIDDASCGLIKNEIYTIRKIENRSDTTLVYLKEIPHGHYNHRFELVEESDSLQELVDKANEGLYALTTLYRKHFRDVEIGHFRDVEIGFVTYTQLPVALSLDSQVPRKIRIKHQTPFEPFTTSTGWEVRVGDGKRLYIGCLNFDSEEFKRMLDFLLGHGGVYPAKFLNGDPIYHPRYFSTKNGIKYLNYILPWPDAERIYKQLREYLK